MSYKEARTAMEQIKRRETGVSIVQIRRMKGVSILGMLLAIPVLLLIVFLLALGFYEARKAFFDYQVREMCEKDGGIKVYETVKLPADKFNEWGQVNFYKPTQGENSLGLEYQFKRETTYYREGNPAMYRGSVRVSRKNDRKLLGQSIFYVRGGGDLPGPWHDSSYHCPTEYGDQDLFKKIFIIGHGE